MKRYFFIILLLFFVGCGGFNIFEGLKPKSNVISRTKGNINSYNYSSIAIFPFKIGESVPNEAREVESLFYEKLLSMNRYKIYPSYLVEEVIKKMDMNLGDIYDISKTIDVGKSMGVGVILKGEVTRYKELEGYRWGAKSPASVSFDVYMIDVNDGTILWSGSFDKTEESLSQDASNIKIFIEGGGVWHKRYEIAEMGVNEILKIFPGLKLGEQIR